MTILLDAVDNFGFDYGFEDHFEKISLRYSSLPECAELLAKHKNDAVLCLGGGVDVYPFLYGKDSEHCGNLDLSRDVRYMCLTNVALRFGIPILGICAGHQFLGVHVGKVELWRDLRDEMGVRDHPMWHHVNTFDRFANLYPDGKFVNSYHHQAVKETPKNAILLAQALDGVIESLWYPNEKIASVQWHPEYRELLDIDLINNLLDLVRGE